MVPLKSNTDRESSPWKAGLGAGLGILGAYFGTQSPGFKKGDFNSDPDYLAKKRYTELIDPNSDSNKTLLGKYMRIAGNATPGKDTLMAPIRAAGGGYLGSAAIAAQQAKGLSQKGQENAFEGWTNAVIGNEQNASKYLGLEYERGMNEEQGWMKYQEDESKNKQDMWGDVSELGGTLLGMFL